MGVLYDSTVLWQCTHVQNALSNLSFSLDRNREGGIGRVHTHHTPVPPFSLCSGGWRTWGNQPVSSTPPPSYSLLTVVLQPQPLPAGWCCSFRPRPLPIPRSRKERRRRRHRRNQSAACRRRCFYDRHTIRMAAVGEEAGRRCWVAGCRVRSLWLLHPLLIIAASSHPGVSHEYVFAY
jgi:hypothetical protein